MHQSVQSLSCVWLFVTPWTPACHASLSITNSQSLLKLMSIESVMKSNHLILWLSRSPPAFNLSQNWGLFQVVRSSYQAAKVLELQLHHQSFQLNIQDRFPLGCLLASLHLLAVQETLKSSPTPQFKSINSLVLSFLYSPTLTSIHDHCKNHSFD